MPVGGDRIRGTREKKKEDGKKAVNRRERERGVDKVNTW